MRLNILIGGKAGQGINKFSEIITEISASRGLYNFNYRDYPSLIRGGHNFNIISISDKRVGSIESKIDLLFALDNKTIEIHKKQLKQKGIIIKYSDFPDLGRNLNIAMAGALSRLVGIEEKNILSLVKKELGKEAEKAAEIGFKSQKKEICKIPKLKNNIKVMNGSQAISQGFIDSKADFYFAYPMTPATGVLHHLGSKKNKDFQVFQPENEISVINMALGCSFTGKKTMIGTSGGGFDLMSEGMSFQGISEIPLVIYLASRPGPGTGVPTYSSQSDLNIALKSGHGEFPRAVIAPGDVKECIEKVDEAFYLSEKFSCLSILLSDKHLAESEFSFSGKLNKKLGIPKRDKIPGKDVVRANSYEHTKQGYTSELPEIAFQGAERRLKKYEEIKKQVKKFQMIKIHGNKQAKNLVIGFGSTKTVILDALPENFKFLQILYLKPMSEEIKKYIQETQKAGGKVVVVENNSTGQLGRLIREKTGIKIEDRILKYDSRPFNSDKLKNQIEK